MISHVVLVVSDLELSEGFYLDLLGPLGFCKADAVPGQYTRLTNGSNAVLVLSPVEEPYLGFTHHRRGVGMNHLAFRAPSPTVVDEVVEAMARRGISPLGEGRVDTGYRGPYDTVSFEDPDRIMIEVVCHGDGYFAPTADDLFPGG